MSENAEEVAELRRMTFAAALDSGAQPWPAELPLTPGEEYAAIYDKNTGKCLSPPLKSAKVVGRNDPCPCGSGKKHKKCCRTR